MTKKKEKETTNKLEEVKIPKKRGRKPKLKSKTDEIKIPKKRGRKPKEIPNKEIIKKTEEPIILHLPIKNINSIDELYIPKPYLTNNNYKHIVTSHLPETSSKRR